MTAASGEEPSGGDGVLTAVGGPESETSQAGRASRRMAAPAPAGQPRRERSRATAGRVAAAALIVGLTLAAGYAAGRAGPLAAVPAAPARPVTHAGHGLGGLQVSAAGYTLELTAAKLAAGRPGELAFRITDPTGEPVTAFQQTHERLMHLVLVGRDFTGYQHVHPDMSGDGTWRAEVTPPAAGPYRAFADFWPVGLPEPLTLGVDVPVPGRYAPRLPTAGEETILVDGYTATIDGGLRPGEANQILVWLGKDGRPVDDLQPYLGAYGHLVVLRHGDLAYLHVHPAPASGPSSVVAFTVQVPSAGIYRLFFEFRHRDVVHVAGFTLTAS